MKPVRIPQRVDEPPHILLWSADELIPIVVGLAVGVFLQRALLCTLAGVVLAKVYRRFRETRADGYLFHLLWRAGFWPGRARSMKNPYVKRYIE